MGLAPTAQLPEPGDGYRRHPSSRDEVDGCACPGHVRVPRIDLVKRNEANNPEADGQAHKADGEAIADVRDDAPNAI